VFYDVDEDLPDSQEDFSSGTASLSASGSATFDGTSANADAQAEFSETIRFMDGRFVGLAQEASFSARASMTNPPAVSDALAEAYAGADGQSCFDFRVDGEDIRYVLELAGDSSKSMYVATRLFAIDGGVMLVDYSTGGPVHALSREGVLSAGRSYTFCVYFAGKAVWESHRRTQIQTELEGRLDVNFTLAPLPPP
jgi:hypothetical protein